MTVYDAKSDIRILLDLRAAFDPERPVVSY
jgi:hypothetical protein